MAITVETNEVAIVEAPAASEIDKGEVKEESVSEQEEIVEDSDPQDDSEKEDEEKEETEKEDNEEEEEEEKPKKRSGFKKRIDRFNRRLSEKDTEIADLRTRLSNQGPQDKADEIPQNFNEAPGKPLKPDEDNFGTYDEFLEAQDSYLEDLTEWKVEQRFNKQAESMKKADAQTEYQKQVQTHTARVVDFRKEHTDFDAVVSEGLAGTNPSIALEAAIMDSDLGADIVYNLAQNPEEFDRINILSPQQTARAIGRLEAQLEAGSSKSEKKVIVKSKAPKPMGKVGTKGKATVKDIYDSNMSQKDFEHMRNEQIKKRKAY